MNKLAKVLANDLNPTGLKNYIAEQGRMIANEVHMGRDPRLYKQRLQAAQQALKFVEGAK